VTHLRVQTKWFHLLFAYNEQGKPAFHEFLGKRKKSLMKMAIVQERRIALYFNAFTKIYSFGDNDRRKTTPERVLKINKTQSFLKSI